MAIAVANECGISLWLHGHIHNGFILEPSATIPFPIICSGSATQTDRWSYNEYAIDGWTLNVLKRTYNPKAEQFEDGERRMIQLR